MKVLICEDSRKDANTLAKELEAAGYNVVKLVKEFDHWAVLEGIEAKVNGEQPKVVIVDGLCDSCYQAIELAIKAKPDVKPIICTGGSRLFNEAREKGYVVFSKKDMPGLLDYLKRN